MAAILFKLLFHPGFYLFFPPWQDLTRSCPARPVAQERDRRAIMDMWWKARTVMMP
ncbi:hypothetical protein NO221_05660 [Gluconacetobacter entanii]|jgi:hypothetical protein|nr:hypothetical protein [Gluconacetobacter entanii]